MRHGLAILTIALLALTSYGDTFTHKKTGETLDGSLVTKTRRDGKEVLFVTLNDGQTRFLDASDWTVSRSPSTERLTKSSPARVRCPTCKGMGHEPCPECHGKQYSLDMCATSLDLLSRTVFILNSPDLKAAGTTALIGTIKKASAELGL